MHSVEDWTTPPLCPLTGLDLCARFLLICTSPVTAAEAWRRPWLLSIWCQHEHDVQLHRDWLDACFVARFQNVTLAAFSIPN